LYYYDANDFATLAVTAIPLGIYFAFARTRLFRALSWCGIAALAVGFVWSGSRGGLLALFAVVAYVLVRYSSIPKRWRIGSLAIITLLAVGTASESYWTRMATILSPKDDYNLTGEEGRIQIWRRGMGYMLANPVVGVGAGNFSTAEGTISPLARRRERGRGVRWAAPHNTYLQVGAELGIPGLVIFGGFFLAVFTTLRTVRRRAAGLADGGRIITLAQSLTAALVGYAVGGFFLSLAYHDMLYALCGIAVALWRVVSRATPTGALTEAPAAPSTGMVTVIRAPA
jgi:O-antigen ligase